MQLTITTPGDDIYTLDISEDLELENFKALLEFESGVPSSEIALLFNGNNLTENTKTLQDYGIKDGDMLLMQRMRRQPVIARAPQQLSGMDWSSISVPGRSNNSHPRPPQPAASPDQDDPSVIRDMFLSDPHQLSLLKERNPPLAEALLSGSIEKFTEVLSQQRQERAGRDMRRIRQLMADPLDPNAQKEIAEEIRMSNVNANMETAMEYTPESFGQVVMLYINCMVNGHPVKAFVDSGAQMTIMSKACAEKCNIMRLVDHRWAGIAKGVGVQKIIGRVHMAQIQIEDVFLPTSFSVLEDQPMDMLLGLDMLKRHQCCIDLKKNILHIGTTKTDTRFLPESELPECARLGATGSGAGASPRHYGSSLQELEDRELAEALTKSSESSVGTSSVAGSSASGVAPSILTSEFPEETVQRLMQMGFSRDDVLEQLGRSGGNADLAATILLAKSIKPPTSR